MARFCISRLCSIATSRAMVEAKLAQADVHPKLPLPCRSRQLGHARPLRTRLRLSFCFLFESAESNRSPDSSKFRNFMGNDREQLFRNSPEDHKLCTKPVVRQKSNSLHRAIDCRDEVFDRWQCGVFVDRVVAYVDVVAADYLRGGE